MGVGVRELDADEPLGDPLGLRQLRERALTGVPAAAPRTPPGAPGGTAAGAVGVPAPAWWAGAGRTDWASAKVVVGRA
ncbi:hypothetical protein, partial [Streptomyces fradiae]|uniref:hypothetical protein n=1 Tax=Streptomyces fradiae TaxID=1906 RepID=UPI001CA5CE68